jgi:hypothetical protein
MALIVNCVGVQTPMTCIPSCRQIHVFKSTEKLSVEVFWRLQHAYSRCVREFPALVSTLPVYQAHASIRSRTGAESIKYIPTGKCTFVLVLYLCPSLSYDSACCNTASLCMRKSAYLRGNGPEKVKGAEVSLLDAIMEAFGCTPPCPKDWYSCSVVRAQGAFNTSSEVATMALRRAVQLLPRLSNLTAEVVAPLSYVQPSYSAARDVPANTYSLAMSRWRSANPCSRLCLPLQACYHGHLYRIALHLRVCGLRGLIPSAAGTSGTAACTPRSSVLL